MEIYLEDLSPDDRPLVVPGARISIGPSATGTWLVAPRMRASLIKMQRLPGWTADDLREAQGWATRIQQLAEDA